MRRVIHAVPGAGKTRALLALARERRALLLAYNREIAQEMSTALGDAACVFTFHALCTRCVAPVRDDRQLQDALDEVESGTLAVHDVPDVDLVLVDEAQDVRAVYARLLRTLGLHTRDMVVAGDVNQEIYNFDPDFPATSDTLCRPERVFGGMWTHESFTRTHRLSEHAAAFVTQLFGVSLEAVHRGGNPVEVRAAQNAYLMHVEFADLWRENDVLLLADRKRGNRSLRVLLNELSRRGRTVHVHGLDDTSPVDDALTCGTFWSAKGLEAPTVVVLLPGRAPRNPTYVALTRAARRLVLVLDSKEPHAAACQTILACPEHCRVWSDFSMRVVRNGAHSGDADASLTARPRVEPRFGDLDACHHVRHGARCVVTDVTPPPAGDDVVAARDAGRLPLRPLTVRLALVALEHRACGRVRAMEHVLHPSRLDFDKITIALQAGLVGRAVPAHVTDDALLAPDLRTTAIASYVRMTTLHDAAVVAAAIEAWDGWDHTMRRALPVEEWLGDAEQRAVDFAARVISPVAHFDRLLRGPGGYVRVHATDDDACYHVVLEASSDDAVAALKRAALHPRRACVLVDLAKETARRHVCPPPE